jgi:hypothetical protein
MGLIHSVAQHALNVATMNIPNATVYDLPDNLHEDHVAKIFNSVELDQSSLLFGSKLHDTQLVMHFPQSPPPTDFCTFQWPRRNIAYFTMPEQHIKHGMNKFEVTADLTVMENSDDFVHWSFAMIFGCSPNGTEVFIAGQPKLSALGIVHTDLKMGKKLNCSYVPTAMTAAIRDDPMAKSSKTVEEFVTARRHAGVGGLGPVEMSCQYMGNLDDDLLDTILQNFTNELEHPSTTSTLAPTTLAPTTLAPSTTNVTVV